jgi:putative PIN family toxin of toxin-antitoxin system
MRLVLDTDVVVAAMRSPRGGSAELLRRIHAGAARLLLSVPLAVEYESICHEAEHRLASGLSAAQVDVFLNGLISLAEPVEIYFLWRPLLRDAGDEMVLEAAVNGRAGALVTFNQRDFGNAPSRFGIDLLLPKEVLRRIPK